MLLSICIPVFNFSVETLIKSLHAEIVHKNLEAEILLLDDASTEYLEQFQQLQSYCNSIIQLKENHGRSKARNLFLEHTKGDYLLIMDCDVQANNPNFIENYINFIKNNPETDLIYGGFTVLDDVNNLRNLYSKHREISTDFGKASFDTFKTANFIIKKEIFKKYPFNENLKQYGYEDYLFAKTLENDAINYYFLDNSVVHLDYSSNQEYLVKLKQSMYSLKILTDTHETKNLLADMKLLKVVSLIEKYKITPIFNLLYSLLEKKIETNLLSDSPSIRYMDLFKLGNYLKIK